MNTQEITADLREALETFCPQGGLKEVYEYAMFPTGKLFRAKMVWAVALDHGRLSKGHRLLASSIECHHAYTLLHDDLPCMDNDDERRGRPSAHRKFNEWKALLAGNGLLNLSYRILSDIDHPQARTVLKIFSHALGPKGLIAGQYADLSQTAGASPQDVLTMYELKTARLIQCSLVGSYLLCDGISYRQALNFAKLGKAIGRLFQLLDDLMDCAGPPIEFQECQRDIDFIFGSLTGHNKHLGSVVQETFQKISHLANGLVGVKQNSFSHIDHVKTLCTGPERSGDL